MKRLFILDASVAVKWFFLDEPQRDMALTVRDHLVEHPENFVVPPLFFTELIHVLARKSNGDEKFSTQAIEIILGLGIRCNSLSNDGFLSAVQFSCEGLSGYDATYAALAKETNGKWLSADLKALKKLEKKLTLSLLAFKKS